MSGGGDRVSIPSSVRNMIQNLKEIAGNNSEDEIYAMLKECSMDPDETAQKLLLQDTFHEVKRKRDRRKESMNNKESSDSRWRPGVQGRVSRGGRAKFVPRYTSHDAASGKNSGAGKEKGASQAVEKGVGPSFSASEEKVKEATLSASSAVEANGPYGVPSGGATVAFASNQPAGSGTNQQEVSSSPTDGSKVESVVSPTDADKSPTNALGSGDTQEEPVPVPSNTLVSLTPTSSTVCFSSSDPVLLPSNDSRLPGTVGTIKREVGSRRTTGELNAVAPAEKSASESGTCFPQGKMPNKSQGVGKSQLSESSQSSSASVHGVSSGSRPSSNYSSRSQQMIGPQKVGSNKEWKPKPTNPIVLQGSSTVVSSEVKNVPAEYSPQSQPMTSVLDSEEATSKLQKKLVDLHLPQHQHVIIPNHIHVPESERTKFSFGSFDASFGVTSTYVSGPESDKGSIPPSKSSQGIEENEGEHGVSNENKLLNAEEGAFSDHPESPKRAPGNLSGEADVSSGSVADYNESKQENVFLSGGQPYSVVQTSPSYNFGIVPPMLGSEVAPIESSESQARDVSRLPSFVVQQPFDPTSYYQQFYRSGADGDGRVSPFPSPGVATKYNGNGSVLPPHASPSPQEGGSLGMTTGSPTPVVTEAGGLMQNSIVVTQQPIPVFRPPTGLHISHYPPNYIPYGHYFSPFYVPPPGLHQFLSNGAFPQQPQAGSVYPAPPAAAATSVKYSLPQYKTGNNAGNSAHIGMPSGYGPYGSTPAGYNPSSAATANSNANEDLGASQFKESNVYITGQQSEGSAVWIAAPGRDISGLPASSFYSLPPQGQHVTYAPTQAGHGTFTSLYHPAQAVTATAVHPLIQQSQTMAGAVDMVGPAAGVYQQPQHQQINWPSNY